MSNQLHSYVTFTFIPDQTVPTWKKRRPLGENKTHFPPTRPQRHAVRIIVQPATTPPRHPCQYRHKPFYTGFDVVTTFENSASLLSCNCSSQQRYATRDRSSTPFAVHLAVPRLLSIQFLVIRYLETISRVVLRVYTTGHSLASLSADPHTLLVQKQRVCVWGCCACGRNTRP